MPIITFTNLPYRPPRAYAKEILAHLKRLDDQRRFELEHLPTDFSLALTPTMYHVRIHHNRLFAKRVQVGYAFQQYLPGTKDTSITIGLADNLISQGELEDIIFRFKNKIEPGITTGSRTLTLTESLAYLSAQRGH
jgi:hypothetical protein